MAEGRTNFIPPAVLAEIETMDRIIAALEHEPTKEIYRKRRQMLLDVYQDMTADELLPKEVIEPKEEVKPKAKKAQSSIE